jgi:hypothetical protein
MNTQVIPLTYEGVTLTTYQLDASQEMSKALTRPAAIVLPGGTCRVSRTARRSRYAADKVPQLQEQVDEYKVDVQLGVFSSHQTIKEEHIW